jgi:hypothetical protein
MAFFKTFGPLAYTWPTPLRTPATGKTINHLTMDVIRSGRALAARTSP